MVARKLHDERCGIAREHLRLLQNDAAEDNRRNADEVSRRRNPARIVEQRAGNQRDDRHLCAAGNERGGHDGHLAVAVVFNRAGRHDARNAAAGGDQHRDEGFAGQAQLAENTVHDERDARHVTDVFEDCQHEKQYQHLRNEAKHRADAADDAVADQTDEPFSAADVGQPVLRRLLNPCRDKCVVRKVGND